ncbi:MAG: SRPBCC family protein [Desulfuromonadales bacterium]
MAKGKVETGRIINAPAEAVWRLITDTRQWPQWGPSVVAVECDSRYIGPESRGRVKTAIGVRLPFRVTRFEQGLFWAWTVAGVPATGHRLESLGPGRSRLIFEIPLIAAPYTIVCQMALGRIACLLQDDAPQ